MVIIILSCAWIIGIFIGTMYDLPLWLLFLALVPLPLLISSRFNRKKVIVASLAIFLTVSGGVYSYATFYHTSEQHIRYYNDGGPAEIKGMIASDPDVRDKSARLIIAVKAIRQDGEWRETEGKALVLAPRYPGYKYGDILLMQGEPETPPTLDDFDYRGYLEHQGIYTTIYFPQIEILESGKGFLPLAWIYYLRSSMARSLAEVLPEPQASLAQGILLGLRGNIPDDLNNNFARSGTSHLLAISGFNLAVMAGIMLAVGIWLFGRRHYLYVWLAVGAVWFYTIITGFNPPVVRGAVMASLFLLAEALGRQRSAAAALTLAAAIMAGASPYVLGDASFQLSFLAMGGLVFIHPIFSNYGKQLVEKRFGDKGTLISLSNVVIDTVSVTLAAVIAVWPVIAYYFGMFSIAGPLATFLLTPVQPVIIIIGTITALTGLASALVAQVFGWVLWPFLTYMISVVQWLGSSAFSAVEVGWINPGIIIAYYAVLALAIWLYTRRQRMRSIIAGAAGLMKAGVNISYALSGNAKWIAAPLLLLAVLTTFTAAAMPDEKLRVSFLDVGEGDAILVQKGGAQVLIDGGPSPQAVTLELSRQMPFWDRMIDVVILTHPHNDHLAGLVEVLKRYKVKTVIYPGLEYDSPTNDEWRMLINEKGIESIEACAGWQITMGETGIKLLNPPGKLITGTESDIDNNSVVVLVQEANISFLLTGDIMREAEWELIRGRADIVCTVLKAAHHGSDTSSTLEFLAVAAPQIAVISCGADNKFEHPAAEIIERLGEKVGKDNIYRTDESGTITFITDGDKLWVETER